MTSRARTTRNALLVALALVPAPAASAGAGGATPRVAVVVGASASPSAAAAIAQSAAEAARQAGTEALPPEEAARALRTTHADATACGSDAACAVATCSAAGADFLLTATVTEAGSGWLIEMRLRDGRRGSVRGQGAETVERDERSAGEAAARLAQRLVRPLLFTGDLPPPVIAPPATSSRRSADVRLAARAAPDPAPSVHRRLGTVLAATGAALLAGGAAAGALAWSSSNDANASLATGDLGGFVSARRSSRTLAWTGAALGGAGGVALAAGAWLRLGRRTSRVSLGLEPGAAGARLAIAF